MTGAPFEAQDKQCVLWRACIASHAPGFHALADAGRQSAHGHLHCETLDSWPLEHITPFGKPRSYHVAQMRLDKNRPAVIVSDFLTLAGIPPKVYDYRLGNRSAPEWVIDQYRVKEDKRSGITHDPNRPDEEECIARLLGQVIRVSMETVKIVNGLPEDYGG